MTMKETIKERLSPNFNQRPAGTSINLIVLHYTDLPTADEALDRLCDPEHEVSAHYLIAEDGDTFRIVADHHRAWHAGVSVWEGVHNVNDYSIGIELANPGHSHGYLPFPAPQIDALITLLGVLCAAHTIDPARVVGHSDIAPTRKQDPGHLFPWHNLYKRGYGLWPRAIL